MKDEERTAGLARTCVDVVDTLVPDYGVADVLDVLARRCTSLLGAAAAGVLLLDTRGEVDLVAASDRSSALLSVLDVQNQGPVADCARRGREVHLLDLREHRTRWPELAAAAAKGGFRALHALPLHPDDDAVGALVLLDSAREVRSSEDLRTAQALVDMVSLSIVQHRQSVRLGTLAAQLEAALESRAVIEQAKGVLAESAQVEMGVAFAMMRTHSRENNRKLALVAADVVAGSLRLSRP